jgi:predicted P-loop ATPase
MKFATGFGAKHTENNTGNDYPVISGAEIAAMAKNPPSVSKPESQWIIASGYHAHDARSHSAQYEHGSFGLLVIDVDEDGPGLDILDGTIVGLFGDVGRIIYSSRSAKFENLKWRALVFIKEPITGEEYYNVQNALFDEMDKRGIKCDRALARPGQLIYLPNRGDHYEFKVVPKAKAAIPSIITQRVAEHKAKEERAKAEMMAERDRKAAFRAANASDDDENLTEWFNERKDVEVLMQQYGYEKLAGSWKSPMSTTGSFAVKVFGQTWVSLSGTDYDNGIGAQTESCCWGDSYDLFAFFEHKNDHQAAWRAIGAEKRKEGVVVQLVPQSPFQAVDTPLEMLPEVSVGNVIEPAFVFDDKGRFIFNHHNVMEVFRCHHEWVDVFAFDDFAQRKMLMKQIPGTRGNPAWFKPRELRDSDYIATLRWLHQNEMPRAQKGVVQDCVDAQCEENIISPVKHWLESLKVKNPDDNILEDWIIRYMGAVADNDEEAEYIRQVSSKWLISAVARALTPGAKADAVLIMEGSQGAGKSTALRFLCGDEWFGDALPPMHTKDASDYVRGKWIVELAELSNVNKSEVEVVKAFVSRTEERFRPAYGRSEISYPRHCVFAGTTNKADYLRDETGNRRFWPIKIGRHIDTNGIKAAREEIWAHAVKAFKNGAEWWLDAGADVIARREQDKRLSVDEWAGKIESFVEELDEVSITQVCTEALFIEVRHIGRAEQNRISAIFATLGFERDGKFHRGPFRNQSRFRRKKVRLAG